MKQPEKEPLQDWAERLSCAGNHSTRLLVLAAHPDDESIGASSLLPRFDSWAVFLTDGAPRDSRLWPEQTYRLREEYAAVRRREAAAALEIARVGADEIRWLGGVDQESANAIPLLTSRLAEVLLEVQPAILITHPYEGGHPDHDTAALIARLAVTGVERRPPELIEMTSYHSREGRCVTGEFLNTDGENELTIVLSEEQRERKRQMFAAHASQRRILAGFSTDRESFRPTPAYDFTRAPHDGKLWYECMGWPITGEQWRSLAAAALSQPLHAQSCP